MTMADETNDLLEQLDRHLMAPCQAWLFGAGISKGAGVPLMVPLTARIRAKAKSTPHETVLDALFAELPAKSHIEHLLSHLGDYAALAERAKLEEVAIGATKIKATALTAAHTDVVKWIAETVRWGYRAAQADSPEEIGDFGKSIVSIGEHKGFIEALFKTTQAGLQDRRGAVRLFSTNYDTLLEDALALCAVSCWDGFSGGAVAYRNFSFGEGEPASAYRAHVIKLHGSSDWHLGDDGRVWRVRDGDNYPEKAARVLIHPQSTKYLATQRDPFAAQFDLLRRTLSTRADNVLAICGYSFGDEHINQELEFALAAPDNRTTVLVFMCEAPGWPDCITRWRNSTWAKRLYVVTERAVYVGDTGPFNSITDEQVRDWWTFSGVTRLLKDGAEGCL
jgi:hypothetical protein